MDLSPKITNLKNKLTKIPNKDKLRTEKQQKRERKKKLNPLLQSTSLIGEIT